jgi:5,10-methylenetetrahydromethanopterin reductase
MTDAKFDGLDIGLYSISPTAENRAVAIRAEARGFKRVWLAEDHHSRDLLVQATAIATATKSIQIGLGIINPFTRHPAQIAMAVADIEELCGPRIVLGLGAAHSSINAHGLENPRPITALKEAGEICSRMLRGERVIYEGKIFRLPAPGAKLRFPLARSGVPLYFGTMGPRTLRQVVPAASPAFAENCMANLRDALAQAGRSIDEIDISCYIIFSVDRDRDSARRAVKPLVAHYVRQIPDTARYELAGLDVPRMQALKGELQTAFLDDKLQEAAENLPDDVVDALAVTGTPEDCIEGLQAYAKIGIKTPVLYHSLGPDRVAAIDLIADTIRPALLAG